MGAVICSWCRKLIREEPKLADDEVSDGICPECYKQMKKIIKAEKIREEVEDEGR